MTFSTIEKQVEYWKSQPPHLVGPLNACELGKRLKKAHPNEMGRVLDFGCGVGRLYEGLQPFTYYVGVDISAFYLSIFRIQWPNVFLAHIKQFEIPLPENDFHTVICYSVFTHLEPPQMRLILSEFHRVLKNGKGIVLVSIFEREVVGDDTPLNWITIPREEFLTLCNETHFTVKGTEHIPETIDFYQTLYTLEC